MTTTQILKRFFGLKDGQKLGDFVGELKALSPEEKVALADMAAVELGETHDH